MRVLDLKTRLFRYPCSYLVESTAFKGLPPVTKAYVARRLKEVLEGGGGETFAHLSAEDRRNLLEMLRELQPEVLEPTR